LPISKSWFFSMISAFIKHLIKSVLLWLGYGEKKIWILIYEKWQIFSLEKFLKNFLRFFFLEDPFKKSSKNITRIFFYFFKMYFWISLCLFFFSSSDEWILAVIEQFVKSGKYEVRRKKKIWNIIFLEMVSFFVCKKESIYLRKFWDFFLKISEPLLIVSLLEKVV
jgi:hypothetical protein